MRYPVTLTRDDNDTILVMFPDVPEAITYGDTEEEALQRGIDALATALEALMKERRDIPTPSPITGPYVQLPALMAAKANLYRTMREQHVGKAQLSERLHWHLPQVDRLFEMRHSSRLDQIEAAFNALGKRLVLTIEDKSTMRIPRARHRTRRPRVHPGVLASAERTRLVARKKK